MRMSPIEGHRVWASVYDSAPNPILSLERRTMRTALLPIRPSRVIDVACGTGQSLSYFQQAGSDVFGCDACESMLLEGLKIAGLRNRLVLADAECIPFRGLVADLIVCSLSLGYFTDIDRVFQEFAAMAKSGGLVAVSDLHPDALASGWTRSFHLGHRRIELEHHPRSLKEIDEAAARAGLRRTSLEELYFGPPELPVFQKAGREQLFKIAQRVPALFLTIWEKPCC